MAHARKANSAAPVSKKYYLIVERRESDKRRQSTITQLRDVMHDAFFFTNDSGVRLRTGVGKKDIVILTQLSNEETARLSPS